MPDKDEKKLGNGPGKQAGGGSPDDFDFSDIPILGQGKSDKREAFSFETFDKDKQRKDPIASFTKMLKAEPAPEQEPQHHARESTEDKFDPEFLEQQKQKWEKKTKDDSARKSFNKKMIPAACLILIIVIALSSIFVFLFQGEKQPPPPPKLPSKPSAKPRPPAEPAAPAPTPIPVQAPAPAQPQPPAAAPAPPAAHPEAKPEVKAEPKPEAKPQDPAKKTDKPAVQPPAPPKRQVQEEPEETPAEKAVSDLKALLSPEGKDSKPASDEVLAKKLAAIQTELPEDLETHKLIIALLGSKGKSSLAKSAYLKWASDKPDSFCANFIAGSKYSSDAEAIGRLRSACSLAPSKEEPFLCLAKLYCAARDWAQVAEVCEACLMGNPDSEEARKTLAIARIMQGSGEQAIVEFNEFLKAKGLSGARLALKIVDLAQRMADPAFSQSCIDQLASSPPFAERYLHYLIRHKMLYGPPPQDGDFDAFLSKDIRQLQMVYLLSKGETSRALLSPTPPDEFPDFWKVFLSWKDNDASWKGNAQKILDKAFVAGEQTPFSLIAKVWLGRLKLEEAREQIGSVDPQDEPLCIFLLAEAYKRSGNNLTAKVLYAKALKYKPNLYKALIERYAGN